MSVSGIFSSNLFSYESQNTQTGVQKFQQEFQQLGQDLQSGNLSAAQSDFASLQQLGEQAVSSSKTQLTSAQESSPLAQAYTQLSKDLQSGNLSGAQQDYANLQQDLQYRLKHVGGHHHHHGGGRQSNEISQTFQQLGQALQSGDLSSAESIYSTLQQDIQGIADTSTPTATGTATNSVSVNA